MPANQTDKDVWMPEEIYIPPGGPPRVPPLSPEIYGRMGEANIVLMIADFYNELEQSAIRGMFPADMAASAERSAAFFVGLLGGPPLYHRRYGNPMMRARHMPFPIDEDARQEWLACFHRTLDRAIVQYDFPAEHLPDFRAFLEGFSGWMVNKR